ncbi:hypothetical protein BO94DRAFT_321730 [Aspergillus sclerotioniger CBS 115572]|uniref:Tautomerase cis-CaaD-like domain-containing protein n=1 Tax=Aspergillus sclerotioniger CBS 115572 TaxID=1450535 RepID=A0A317X680_9EURO|nr:hypothetical protein BO94DRAFT_321730 [Aspergillus sclerotioniger CBS 115572]PWY94136.1 hypothetical protein BO94DRAFT_321730 [Aspergillus sclerotioniger CBS 115572]
MPLYEFEHAIPLKESEKQAIAHGITEFHANAFHAPRYIVNCRFIDISDGPLSDIFVGGKRRQINRLFVTLRSGTGRTVDQLRVLIDSVNDVWDNTVGGGGWEKQLRSVYIKGSIDAAKEGGFHLPLPEYFEQWVKDNTTQFRTLAAEGDPDFIQLAEEIETRPEFQR